MYLPFEARFGSFITGAILAVQLLNSPSEDNQNGKFKKFIFLGLIFLYVLSPVIVNVDTLLPNFGLIVTLSIASSRQIFALSQAFILFTALCPTTHPYHSPRIKRFLSLSIWIPISKLSYLVYVIHWRISFELIFGGSLMFLTKYSITFAIFISLPIVLFISQFISCIWYIIIEKPIEREIFAYLNSDKMYKPHVT